MQKIKLLVIDDEEQIRKDLCRDLSKEGYEAIEVENAVDALKLMDNSIYVAIVDLRMPEMDGLDFIKTISDKFPRTQVIIITGHGNEDDAIEAVKLHVFDYIRKGDLTIERLLEAIEKAVIRYKSLPKLSDSTSELQNWAKADKTVEAIRDLTSDIPGSLSDDISKMRGNS